MRHADEDGHASLTETKAMKATKAPKAAKAAKAAGADRRRRAT